MPKVKIGLNTDQRGELFAENANVFRPGLPSPWPPLRKMTWQEKRMCSSFGHTRTHRILVPCVSWLLTRRVPDDPTPALTRIASTRLRIASSKMLRPTEPQTPLAGSTLMARSPVGQRHKFDVILDLAYTVERWWRLLITTIYCCLWIALRIRLDSSHQSCGATGKSVGSAHATVYLLLGCFFLHPCLQ